MFGRRAIHIAIVCIAIMYIAIVCTAIIMYIAISDIAIIMHIAIRYVATLYVNVAIIYKRMLSEMF